MRRFFTKTFLVSSTVILVVTAIAKIVSLLRGEVSLYPAPFFGLLTHEDLMVGTSIGELIAVGILWKAVDETLRLWTVAWLASLFTVYRGWLWWIGYDGSCGCLGAIESGVYIGNGELMGWVLGFLLVGAYSLLVWKYVDS